MIASRKPCDPERLKLLLDNQLPTEVVDEVTTHVAGCPTCRRELETLAADNGIWQDARCFLQNEDNASDGDFTRRSTTDSQMVQQYLDPPKADDCIGRLGDFEILEVIGCGGMGTVFKGRDSQLNRLVAIKMLAPHLSSSAAARRRFAREAQAAAAVVHPHVLAIHGVKDDGKLPYLIMPLVAGQSLQERIDCHGPLPVKDILRIGMQAAQGLAAAHAQGLIHRDIKPANILLENGVERVLLTDFGLARAADDASLTHSGVIAGTPQYMSPEQTRGDRVDHRTDLFSLGSVMYAMCVGRPPFRAETTMGILRRINDDTPRPLREINTEVPVWLETLIGRLLAKIPAERCASAEAVAQLLGQCLAHTQHPDSTPLPEELTPSNPVRQSRVWLIGFAATTTILLLLGIFLVYQHATRNDTKSNIAAAESPAGSDAEPASTITDKDETQSRVPNADTEWHGEIDQELSEIDSRLNWLQELDDF